MSYCIEAVHVDEDVGKGDGGEREEQQADWILEEERGWRNARLKKEEREKEIRRG